MNTAVFLSNIRGLIARDELSQALEQLRFLLENSPKLDEAILQSARFYDIRKQIRLGVLSHSEANLTQNKIRAGLLELLREVEEQGKQPFIKEELEQAISIVNSKNVLVGSTISAGGNVEIGDRTIHTESTTSRRLRLFLYLFVPVLAIGGALLWQQLHKMNTPLLLTVAVDNHTPNPELPFEGGTVTLQYGEKSETLPIKSEADFKGIPASFGDEQVSLHFEADGFVTIDTNFVLSENRFTLPIRRNNSLARIFGTVKDGAGNPLAGVQIRVLDITDVTKEDGTFSLTLPPEKQRKSQRVSAFLPGYKPWDYTTPVLQGEELSIILQKK